MLHGAHGPTLRRGEPDQRCQLHSKTNSKCGLMRLDGIAAIRLRPLLDDEAGGALKDKGAAHVEEIECRVGAAGGFCRKVACSDSVEARTISVRIPARRARSATAPRSRALTLSAMAMNPRCCTTAGRSNPATSLSQGAAHKPCSDHDVPMPSVDSGARRQKRGSR
jgi:hypothetical protein